MTLAVVDRLGGVQLAGRDVYTATVGGVRVTEPAGDLAIAIAVAGAASGLVLRAGTVALGEVGLAGDVRPVPGTGRRLAELSRLGFNRALVPPGGRADAPPGSSSRRCGPSPTRSPGCGPRRRPVCGRSAT